MNLQVKVVNIKKVSKKKLHLSAKLLIKKLTSFINFDQPSFACIIYNEYSLDHFLI
jgi:hypothetical protein